MSSSSFLSSLPIFVFFLLCSSCIVVDALSFSDPFPGDKHIQAIRYQTFLPDRNLTCGKTMAEIGGPVVMISEMYWTKIGMQAPALPNPVCGTRAQITTKLGTQIGTIGTFYGCKECMNDAVEQIHMIYQQDNPEKALEIFVESQPALNVTWAFLENEDATTDPSASATEAGQTTSTLVSPTDGTKPTENIRRSRRTGGKWFRV